MTESQLSKKWMQRLQQQCAEAKEHILILNCQGKSRLPRGVSDYLVCYNSRWFSIEFKKDRKDLSDYQRDFLILTNRSNGIGLTITIHKDQSYKVSVIEFFDSKEFNKGKERELLLSLLWVTLST